MSIKFNDVSYTYKDYFSKDSLILENLSFVIPKNKITFITGESGAGKSTILQLIKGLKTPKSGTIISTVDTSDIGLVFQHPEIQFFKSTVKKEIEYGLKNIKLSENEIEIKVINVIKRLDLSKEILKKSTSELSAGEKRLVAIASILVMNPKFLLLDEPLASLDGIMSKKIMHLLQGLVSDNVTVVVVSHNDRIIEKYSQNKITLLKNKIKESINNHINIDGRINLIIMLLLILLVVIKPLSFYTYICVGVIELIFIHIFKINIIFILKQLKPILYTSLFILLFNIFIIKSGNLIYQEIIFNNIIKIYDTPFLQTLNIFFQLFLITVITQISVVMTNPLEIIDAFIYFLHPFERIFKNGKEKIDKVSLLLTLCVQFIPIILLEGSNIMMSQKNRGAKKGIKMYIAILIPLFQRVIEHASNLSDGMEIRNYKIGKKRSSYGSFKWNWKK